jgi:N-acetylneuraminate synthase
VEIGSNYNQNFETAKKMIDLVKLSGADAVKFQIFKEKKLYVPNAGKVDYLKSDVQINDLVKKAEVPDDFHRKLFNYCQKVGLIYLCSTSDEETADYLESLGVSAYKITSYDLTNHFLLRHVAKKKKPVILSTGAGTEREVSEAVKVINKCGNNKIILMQCVAQYPADYKNTNLKVMVAYEKKFSVPTGISDHSLDPFVVPYAATAVGAKVIEKHFTLDRHQQGPDHAFAIEPDELKRMIEGVRNVELAIGTGVKKPSKGEEELRVFAYRSIFATKDIKKGELTTLNNSYVLRPGKKERGIDAKFYEKILGKRVIKNIKANTSIKWSDLKK